LALILIQRVNNPIDKVGLDAIIFFEIHKKTQHYDIKINKQKLFQSRKKHTILIATSVAYVDTILRP
jgi:hypothetical protein